MFTRRSATIAVCAACWIGVVTHSVAEPAPYQGVRSLLLGAGLISLLLLTRARRRRTVSPITADIADAFAAHALRTRDRISSGWSAPVIPLPCEPAPAHRWLAPAGATILVTAVVGGLVVIGCDGPDQQRAARPPASGAPPPTSPPTSPPASPSPTKRDPDQSPTAGRETGEATTPSPQPRPDAPTAGTAGRSARDGDGEPATSPTRSTGSSPASPSDSPTTTAGGGDAEPKPTRTPIRRVIRRVAP